MPLLALALAVPAVAQLRIIVFGAHPDDCEIKASEAPPRCGRSPGHKVKFV